MGALLQRPNQATAKKDDPKQDPPASPPTGGDTAETTPALQASDDSSKVSHQGRLLMDAILADQLIRFPTDVSLLNQAREITEALIDELHKRKEINGKKPRTYRQQARKAYLGISRNSNRCTRVKPAAVMTVSSASASPMFAPSCEARQGNLLSSAQRAV